MICGQVLKYVAAFLLLLMFSTLQVVYSNATCENLPTVKNGRLLLEGRQPPFAVNEYISYICEEDFRSDQMNPRITCILQDNVANWTDTDGVCKPIVISCHYPGDIENADRIGDVFLFPYNITYICREGFKMKGSPTKYCSKTGKWQPPNMPECEAIFCPPLLSPKNGEVQLNSRRLNSVATYKCSRNFRLEGSALRVCQADGNWNGSNPICKEITCGDLGPLKYGRIIGNKAVYSAFDIVIFKCDDGQHTTLKCLESGEWSSRPPVCTEFKNSAPKSKFYCSERAPKLNECTCIPEIGTCCYPYQYTGIEIPEPFTDEPTTTAQVNSCEDPGKIKNGYRTIAGFHTNSTVIYTCDEGYELRGKSTLMCLENGKWDLEKLPICVKPLSVPAIIGIVFGVVIFLSLVVGGYLWYRYRMKSSRGYGKKSKALTADATDIEEITGLEKERKQIPVTVL